MLIEITFRVIFSYNVQGISENLIDKKIDYRFNTPNLKNGKAFGESIYTDKNGFRISKNHLEKQNQNILFIGGSVTFGPGVIADKTFVELLNKNSDYNIKNASVFGTNLENNTEIIKDKKNLENIKKIFINFPLDDIISDKISLDTNTFQQNNNIESIKNNKYIVFINNFIRSKSATYVFIKGIIVNPQLNNYKFDLQLYKNKELIDQLEKNLITLKSAYNKEKFFYSIPYAEQVKNNCNKSDYGEQVISEIFAKMNYEIFF